MRPGSGQSGVEGGPARRRDRGQLRLVRNDPSRASDAATTPVAGGGAVRWPRVLVLLLPAWWTARKVVDANHWAFLDGVNLAFHEAGHLFLAFAGETLHVLGGTLGQLAVPALLSAYFLFRRREPFAAAVCAWWAGENLTNIARYMADARDLTLPLVGGGEHDWNTLFYKFGVLTQPWVERISGSTRLAGVLVMFAALAWAGFLCLETGRRREAACGITLRWPRLERFLDG